MLSPFRRAVTLVAVTISCVCLHAAPAHANGIDLPTREAMQGDEITVTGHAWLTCCPTNTPVEHVQLFLSRGSGLDESERVLLFDVAANEEGVISTVFTVPWVSPGRYRLEACGGLVLDASPCLPEGRFTVLPGPTSPSPAVKPDPGGEWSSWSLPVLILLTIGGVVAIVSFWDRRRTPN